MSAPRLQGREQCIYAMLWLERQPAELRVAKTLQDRFRVSRATAYRWFAAWLRAHQALAA